MADQPKTSPPKGMEPFDLGGSDDLGGLSTEMQQKLNKHKVQTRMANERYLRDHPEVDCMVSNFLKDVYLKRPDNIREFAAEHFNDPNLPDNIEMALGHRQQAIKDMKVLQNV